MAGMTEGRLPTLGMTEGAIDNGGHDRRGRKTSGMTEGRLTMAGMTKGESCRPAFPSVIPAGFPSVIPAGF